MRHILFALCVLSPSLSFAQNQRISVTPIQTYLNAVACSASAGSRTATVEVGHIGPNGQAYQLLVFNLFLDYTAATAVTMSCTASPDNGTNKYTIQDCTMASGACTSNDASWSKAISAADKKWPWRVDTTGFLRLDCVFACGAGADTLTVTGYETTK